MKKMNKKRILACLTAAAVATTAFSGCSGKESQPKSGEKTADGKTTLTALINVDNSFTPALDELPSGQELEEKTGVDISWEVVRTGWTDQKTLLLAGGELPDMFFGSRTLGTTDVDLNKSLFTDLKPYLDQMPNVKAMFEDDERMLKLVEQEDGSIWYLPAKSPMRPQCLTATFINQAWLDKLGLDMPNTTEELKEVLRAFKNDDPNGNGIADEIPSIMSGGGYDTNLPSYILGCFGITYNEFSPGNERLMVKDGDIHFVPVMEEYKDAVKYMAELFREGLIDNESFTQDYSQYLAKLGSSPATVGMSAGWTIDSYIAAEHVEDYGIIAPVEGPKGTRAYSANNFAIATAPFSWALSNSCTNKELAIKFIDAMYAPEMSTQLYFGSFDRTLERQEDGKIKVLEKPDPEKVFNDTVWEEGLGNMGPFYVSEEFEQNIIPNTWVTQKLDYDKVYEPYIPDSDEVYPLVVYTPEEANELSVLKTDIDNIVSQKFSQWVSGEADIDAEWDSYVESLENVGLSRMMEIYQKYWEESRG
ncbi:MAG: extracellular solute-binding protein [Erysipelotrichaceae bacterium]|nr:extracellular solute-binding protein [Erysipelotrichaceae bacterium]